MKTRSKLKKYDYREVPWEWNMGDGKVKVIHVVASFERYLVVRVRRCDVEDMLGFRWPPDHLVSSRGLEGELSRYEVYIDFYVKLLPDDLNLSFYTKDGGCLTDNDNGTYHLQWIGEKRVVYKRQIPYHALFECICDTYRDYMEDRVPGAGLPTKEWFENRKKLVKNKT